MFYKLGDRFFCEITKFFLLMFFDRYFHHIRTKVFGCKPLDIYSH
ncbi:MAG: hypothetical protein ACRC2R_12650 [Xenococcaceae cyanobacterium]